MPMVRDDRRAAPRPGRAAAAVCAGLVGLLLGAGPAPWPAPEALAAERVPWQNTRLRGTPEPPPPYRAVRAYPRLPLFQPVYLRPEPGGGRLFFVDHRGDWPEPGGLRVCRDDADVDSSEALVALDRRIYGFCFHPRYEDNGLIYVISNGPVTAARKTDRISSFTVARDGARGIVPGSEVTILEWESNGHDGGDLAFGPDGYLYCPTGDGSTDSDTLRTGQGLDDLLAVMLRIDVDRPTPERPYSIPPDNPFLGVPGARGEIWAYGFRNPWRLDIDRDTGRVWVGQNGQDLWEQVYLVRRGENYGWSVQEGSHPFHDLSRRGDEPIVAPVAEHHHAEARSLTGGIVCRGMSRPDLEGCFVYGDYSTGRIWALGHDGTAVAAPRELADTTLQITGFARGRDGDLLVVDHGGGFYRLEPVPPAPPADFPRRLSDTGLFADVAAHRPAPGLVPYAVNAPLWSDGALKERFLAVPDGERIEYTSSRGWNFPEGTVLVKSFTLEGTHGRPETARRVETRLMVRTDKEWAGYSYRWNDAQTDAELVARGGHDEVVTLVDPAAPDGTRRQAWHYPSRAECMVCHSRAANYVLGLCEVQMNRDHEGPELAGNQLALLEAMGYFQAPLPKPPAELARLVDPADETAPLDARARSYLHANCASCHVEAGGGNSAFSIEFAVAPDRLRLLGEKPLHGSFDIPDAALVAPGDPRRSVLLERVRRRGPGQMPPLASSLADDRAVRLLEAWIGGLAAPAAANAAANPAP